MIWRHRQRGTREDQIEKELRFHLDQHAADLVARGVPREEARRQARLALGGEEQVKEDCRDARRARWLADLGQDLRYALRTLRQRPAFAAVALLTLALGAGATTVMFTVIDGVLLKPLPFPQPERLVHVHGHSANWDASLYGEQNLANFDFRDCQNAIRSLEMAGWLYNSGILTAGGSSEYVSTRGVTANLFSVLGVHLFRGRAFLPEEDRPGGAPVAILGYSLWQRRSAGNPSAIGSAVVVDGQHYTVVGIAPAEFRLDGDEEADVYTPMGQNTLNYMQQRFAHPVGGYARLRPGATLAQAQTELAALGRHLAQQYPDSNKNRTFIAAPLRPDVGDVRSTLWLLLGAVSLVLLIACVNIASLLLARAVSRERELAMRVALGAGLGRLVRQCLTESAVLGLAGGALGILLAALGLRPFIKFWPGSLPRAGEVQLDWRVLLFALAVSLVCGLLFGLAPALRVPTRHLERALRGAARTAAGSSRRLHGGFVASEIALAVVLLVSAGMLGRMLVRLSSLDPGVNIHNVLTARMALPAGALADPAAIRVAWQQVLDGARRVPGVEAVTMVDTVPMRRGNNQIGYWTTPGPGGGPPPENQLPLTMATSVTPDYLKVMGIPLHQGRFFDDHDRMNSQRVVVIDDVMAKEAFGRQDPLGRHVWIGLGSEPWRVVGVVGHVRYWGPAGDDQARVRSQVYYPFAQVPNRYLRRWSELMSIAVRTGVEPMGVLQTLRREVRGATGDQVLYEVRTLEEIARATLERQRFLLLLFGIFAGLALLLACVGIYGVLAYLIGQRVPEIGVRVALGATAGDVMRLVLKQSLAMIAVGVAVGATAAWAAGRGLERLVEGMRSSDPATFAVMVSVLVAAGLFASFLPARRASRIDPVKALRQE